jgi:hypothetical protein
MNAAESLVTLAIINRMFKLHDEESNESVETKQAGEETPACTCLRTEPEPLGVAPQRCPYPLKLLQRYKDFSEETRSKFPQNCSVFRIK